MPKLDKIIQQPEGRRLEFKEKLTSRADLAKTIIAFANDAGGEFYLGIKDHPREVIGLSEDILISLEEKIANIIHDLCEPIILPEISFVQYDGKHLIRIQIFKGSTPPYHLKNKSIDKSTYIKVGSSSRLASGELIAELERQRDNRSFDGEPVYAKTVEQIDINTFAQLYLEKTGEKLTSQILKKLNLFRFEQGNRFPTNALILLSDDDLRTQVFPYGKIECARFKGTVPGDFIDRKTIDDNVALQAEQAYQFVLRHISQGSTDYTGVYRNDRWEYPILAIREIIRNAVIHRDYSLSGKDIKIAIFDDKIEVTSPGKLMPTIDFDDMESGQSDIRNKILAPVFKRLGIIEQWGNGLRLIARELDDYPEIELSWKEPGISFRITFLKKDYTQPGEYDWEAVVSEVGTKLGLSWDRVGAKLEPGWQEARKLLEICIIPQPLQNLIKMYNWTNRTKFRNKYINPLLETGLLMMTIPYKPTSSKQKYILTDKGLSFLDFLKTKV